MEILAYLTLYAVSPPNFITDIYSNMIFQVNSYTPFIYWTKVTCPSGGSALLKVAERSHSSVVVFYDIYCVKVSVKLFFHFPFGQNTTITQKVIFVSDSRI